jgi:uncharacterized membrane protein YccC
VVDYSVIRVGNTAIGIIAGLAVSYLVLPVRGREAVMQASNASLAAAGDLLMQLASSAEPLPAKLHVAMLDRVVEMEKAMRDGRHEFGGQTGALLETVRHAGLVCAGTLTAAIAHSDLCASPSAMIVAAPLFADAAQLARRARGPSDKAAFAAKTSPVVFSDIVDVSGADAIALQGLALGLRKVEFSLGIMGR